MNKHFVIAGTALVVVGLAACGSEFVDDSARADVDAAGVDVDD